MVVYKRQTPAHTHTHTHFISFASRLERAAHTISLPENVSPSIRMTYSRRASLFVGEQSHEGGLFREVGCCIFCIANVCPLSQRAMCNGSLLAYSWVARAYERYD